MREGDETLTDPKRMRLLSAAERAAELAASVASDGPAGGVGHTPRARTAASEIRLAAAALSGGREALLRAYDRSAAAAACAHTSAGAVGGVARAGSRRMCCSCARALTRSG